MLKKQVDIQHYEFSSYITKKRWISYWHQLDETMKLHPQNTLIIGMGDKIVFNCLKDQGLACFSYDIDPDLNPDFIGSVTEIKSTLGSKTFECILCCQVLEHIPFEYFEDTIKQLSQVTTHSLILSLPIKYKKVEFVLKIEKMKIKLPEIFKIIPESNKKFKFNGEHYWEIGVENCSLPEIKAVLQKYFDLKNNYSVRENPYHMFFILEKKNQINY